MEKKHDVFLISPSGKVNLEKLNIAKNRLEVLGFNVHCLDSVIDSDFYFAGSTDRRIKEFRIAMNSSSEIIYAIRGGYGSLELLSQELLDEFLNYNKTIVGCSDITSLLIGLYFNGYDAPLIHGPMPGTKNWPKNDLEIKLLEKCLSNQYYSVQLDNYNLLYRNIKSFEGSIIGGNLRILCHHIGTEFDFLTDEYILFLEDVNERAPAIYQMLLHLEKANKLKKIKALLLSEFVNCGENIQFIEKFIERLKIPVIANLPLGHTPSMIPIILGSNIRYDNRNNILEFNTT